MGKSQLKDKEFCRIGSHLHTAGSEYQKLFVKNSVILKKYLIFVPDTFIMARVSLPAKHLTRKNNEQKFSIAAVYLNQSAPEIGCAADEWDGQARINIERNDSIIMSAVHPILEALIPIADGIAKTIGDNCEVAIHDLTHPKHSILYIVNGSLTGRKKYDSLGPVFKELVQLAAMNEDSLVNYYDYENGHSFKCTKVLIRDENKRIIGCFCINIAIDEYLQVKRSIDNACKTEPIDNFREQKTQSSNSEDDISDLVRDIIMNTYSDLMSNKHKLSKADKVDMVRFLDEKGIFRVKGTVEMIADILKVSKFTVYSYLDQLKSDDAEK